MSRIATLYKLSGGKREFKKYLQEGFYGSRKAITWGREEEYVEFFINPKPAEIRDAQKASGEEKSIRFLIDFDKKDVIIWRGDVLHKQALKVLKINIDSGKIFTGDATQGVGKMILKGSDQLYRYRYRYETPQKINKMIELVIKHKNWISKYFKNVDEFITQIERDYKFEEVLL